MSNWQYDSGGKHKDQKKYVENYERIFGCKECGVKGGQHKMDCSNKSKEG
jgi:hypothetical protein